MDNMEQQQEEQVQPTFTDTKKGGIGPVLGIILIIILLALGGLYYFTQGIDQIPSYESMEQDDAIGQMEEQSDSTEIADIEADAEATDFSELDALYSDLEADAEAGSN